MKIDKTNVFDIIIGVLLGLIGAPLFLMFVVTVWRQCFIVVFS